MYFVSNGHGEGVKCTQLAPFPIMRVKCVVSCLELSIFSTFLPKRGTWAVADPGFPVGGRRSRSGVGSEDSEAVTFRKFCMSKQKNMDP